MATLEEGRADARRPMGDGQPDEEEVPPPSMCFPMDPFKWAPPAVKAFIPSTWLKIQDWTHLSLIIGVLAGVCIILQTVFLFMKFDPRQSLLLVAGAVSIVYSLPVLSYAIKIINQYDDRLQSKQAAAKRKKEDLQRSYNELLSDMDQLLGKSAESSAGLAERSFESKRRDFQRFLERAKQRYGSLFSGTKGESEKMLKQFRRFCLNWLRVFQECSIDPVNRPKKVVEEEEMNRCTSIGEVADLVLERLRLTEVRFISMQRDQDQQMLRKTKSDANKRLSLTNGPGARVPTFAAGTNSTAPAGARQSRGCGWIQCGSSGCSCSGSQTEDGFPRDCRCICMRVVCLSAEHAKLLVGFLFGALILLGELGVFALDLHLGKTTDMFISASTIVEICFMQLMIVVMLARFEELDIIHQFEMEVKELERQNQQVEQQREKMNEFWNNANNLTELWLYRTVPRLDLYKELHSQLEDAPTEDLLTTMAGANNALEELDKNLGALEAWRQDGQLKEDAKKAFGKSINTLCQERDLGELIDQLGSVVQDSMSQFQALPAPAASVASPLAPKD